MHYIHSLIHGVPRNVDLKDEEYSTIEKKDFVLKNYHLEDVWTGHAETNATTKKLTKAGITYRDMCLSKC